MSSGLGIGSGGREHDGIVALGIGAVTALIIGAAALVVGIIPWHHLGIALVSLLVVLSLGFAYTRSLVGCTLGARGPLVAALTMVGFAPVVGHAAWRTLYAPLGGSIEPSVAEGMGVMLAALCSFSLASVVAWWWGTRSGDQGVVILRFATWASVLMCCGLAAFAARRTAPPVDRYADELPLAAELAPERHGVSAFTERRPSTRELGPTGFALGRTCLGSHCLVHVRNATRVRSFGPRVARAAALSLRHDAAAGRLLLLADAELVASMDASLLAWDWVLPSAATISMRVSAPRKLPSAGLARPGLCRSRPAVALQARLPARISAGGEGWTHRWQGLGLGTGRARHRGGGCGDLERGIGADRSAVGCGCARPAQLGLLSWACSAGPAQLGLLS